MYYFSHRVPGRLSRNAQFLAHHLCTSVGEGSVPGEFLVGTPSLSSCRLAGLHWFDHVVRFVARSVVIPHLEVQPLQVHRVLLRVEQRAGYSLLPDFATDFFQATKESSSSHETFQTLHNAVYLWNLLFSANSELPVQLFQKHLLPHLHQIPVLSHHFWYRPVWPLQSRRAATLPCCIICRAVTLHSMILTWSDKLLNLQLKKNKMRTILHFCT